MLKILKLAVPISLSNIIGVIAVLVNTKIVGDVSSYNLYILALFMPLNFWVVSLFESFRVPVTSVAAYAYSRGKLNLIGSQVGCLLFVTMLGIALPFIVFILAPGLFSFMLSTQDLNQVKLFTCYMLPASFLLSAFFIVCSVFNGIGRHKFSMAVTFIGVLFGTSLNYFLSQNTSLAILSMPVSSLITYSLLLSGIVFMLFKMKIFTIKSFKNSFSASNFQIIKRLALPVLATYIIMTGAIIFFTHLLSPCGNKVVAGFSIAYRVQTLLLLPAVSIGMAIGILFNKNTESHNNKLILLDGILICAVIYSVISLEVYYHAVSLVSLITADHDVIIAASHYLKTICFSYVGFSIALCFCIVLDQIGYGVQSALFTTSIFVIEIFSTLMLLNYWQSADALYWSIFIGNMLAGLLSVSFVRFNKIVTFKPKFINRN